MRPIVLLATDLYDRDVKDDTETTLVRAAVNGDVDSFGSLCERYYCAIVAIAYSRLRDRDLAEDAAQEAFLSAFRNISKLRDAKQFGRWATGICRNVSSDMARERAGNKLIGIHDRDLPSKKEDENENNVETVKNIIAELNVGMKEVIYLRYYSKMSYQQISNVLGISQEAVNGRLRRAKKVIAKKLSRLTSVEVKL